MAGLLPIVAGGPGDQYNTTTAQAGHPLGSKMIFADGREFRYAKAGASVALAAGLLNQQTLNSANWDELAIPTARAIGDKSVTVTNGATAITADYFADGILNVEDDTGEAYDYTIRSNSAAATSGVCTVTLYEALQVAWTTSTTVLLFANPYSVTIVHPSPATAMLTGVSKCVVAVSAHGWLQTRGPCSVLVEGTHVINENVIDSASADGAVAPTASTAAGEENYVGVVMEVAATTEYGLVFLRM